MFNARTRAAPMGAKAWTLSARLRSRLEDSFSLIQNPEIEVEATKRGQLWSDTTQLPSWLLNPLVIFLGITIRENVSHQRLKKWEKCGFLWHQWLDDHDNRSNNSVQWLFFSERNPMKFLSRDEKPRTEDWMQLIHHYGCPESNRWTTNDGVLFWIFLLELRRGYKETELSLFGLRAFTGGYIVLTD